MQSEPEKLLVYDLLNDLEGLGDLLRGELNRASWFNAFLLAAGMNQIVEDYLSRDPYSLEKISKRIRQIRRPFATPVAVLVSLLGKALWQTRIHSRVARRMLRWQSALANLVQELSNRAVCLDVAAAPKGDVIGNAESLISSLPGFPMDLRQAVIRLPACFRAFDQHPDDLACLVGKFAERWEDRTRRIVVVGIRTSGSYLSPLCASYMRKLGFRNVRAITLRPGHRLLHAERAAFLETISASGLVLLTDDPPNSGESLARIAVDLERLGFPRRSIVLLLALFGRNDELPPKLRDFESVVLPGSEWTIHQRLAPGAVESMLGGMLSPEMSVRVTERLPIPPRTSPRSHLRALYRAEFTDTSTGRSHEERVLVRGVGQGYLGEHALAVWGRLRKFLPRVYGVEDGLLFQAWLPEESRASIAPEAEESLPRAVASYVAARHSALPVARDWSMGLLGHQPAWELASDILSRVFGRFSRLARPLTYSATRRLLRVDTPSVIDGSMVISRWFVDSAPGSILKVDFDDRAFGSGDMSCYDPLFDLASFASCHTEREWGDELRGSYEVITRQTIPEERWLLYRLLHMRPEDRGRTMTAYFADAYLRDITVSRTGALCAIDLDGVLESAQLGFNSTSPAGALALRALIQHGFRPLIASGRSLINVRERCQAYRLPGGVAEYGAVTYNHMTSAVHDLRSEAERTVLADFKAALNETEGVEIDPEFHHVLRAYCVDEKRERHALSANIIERALGKCSAVDQIQAVQGSCQTDFVPVGVTKARGLRFLANELGVDAGKPEVKPLAFAVGDTVSDLPMFELANLACAPANADASVKTADVIPLRRSYQGGLALGVRMLLGHDPGGCPVCRKPELPEGTAILMGTLAIQDAGLLEKGCRAAVLGLRGGLRALMHELDQRQ